MTEVEFKIVQWKDYKQGRDMHIVIDDELRVITRHIKGLRPTGTFVEKSQLYDVMHERKNTYTGIWAKPGEITEDWRDSNGGIKND